MRKSFLWIVAFGRCRHTCRISRYRDLLSCGIAQGADCLLTGEANHHHAIDAKRLGLSLIAAGHYATEFPVTAAVAEKLRRAFPELEVLVSEDARDPYTYL